MKNDLIERYWEDFKYHCIPPTATEEQIFTTRKVFFAGAVVVLSAIQKADSAKEHLEILDKLFDEIAIFQAETEQNLKERLNSSAQN